MYLLQGRYEGTFYVGWTTDLLRRLAEHNEHLSTYTRRKAPWKLMGFEVYPTVEEAKQRERTLKHNPRMLALFKKRLSRMASGPTTCFRPDPTTWPVRLWRTIGPFGPTDRWWDEGPGRKAASLRLKNRWWGSRPRQVVG